MWFRHFLARLKAFLTSIAESLDEPLAVAPETPGPGEAFHSAVTAPQQVIERPAERPLAYDRPVEEAEIPPDDEPAGDEPADFDTNPTIPVMRLSPPVERRRVVSDRHAHALPVPGEPGQPGAGREPTQPSQPLAANLQRLQNLADAEAFAALSDLDEATRRLLFLRRLVRQRIYNEGFSAEQIPAQYRHSHGLDGSGEDAGFHN